MMDIDREKVLEMLRNDGEKLKAEQDDVSLRFDRMVNDSLLRQQRNGWITVDGDRLLIQQPKDEKLEFGKDQGGASSVLRDGKMIAVLTTKFNTLKDEAYTKAELVEILERIK